MADLLQPIDILAGDKLSLQPIRRLAPATSSPVPIDRNMLAIEAQLTDGQTFMMHCTELTPDRRPNDDYIIMAQTRPGEVSGLLRGVAIYVRGQLHQRLEMSGRIGLTQGLQLVFNFAPRELRL